MHGKHALAVVTAVLMALSLVAGAATAGTALGSAGEATPATASGPADEMSRAATNGPQEGVFADTASVAPSETWRVEVDTEFSGPQIQVADGTVYAVYSGTVEALDAATGDPQWTESFSADFLRVTTDGEGRLYVSGSGYVRSLEQSTGDERWNVSMDGSVVLVLSGVLYVDQGRTIKALDTADGSELWTDDTSSITTIRGVDSETVLVSSTTLEGETRLRGLDASSGTELWETLVPSSTAKISYSDGTIYSLVGSDLSTYDIETGDPIDSVTIDGRAPRFLLPVSGGDYLYGDAVVDGQDFVLGYDAATGEQVANVTSTAGASGNLGSPFPGGDRVYFLDNDAGVRVLNAADGTELGAGGPETFNNILVKNGAAYYSVSTGGESGDAVVRVDIDGSGGGDSGGDGGSGLSPRERALQIAGVSAASSLSQNDITVAITRFNRGQSAGGIDIEQNDITTVITLFERAN
jgi:outer membrane protein assembly factor BamB